MRFLHGFFFFSGAECVDYMLLPDSTSVLSDGIRITMNKRKQNAASSWLLGKQARRAPPLPVPVRILVESRNRLSDHRKRVMATVSDSNPSPGDD